MARQVFPGMIPDAKLKALVATWLDEDVPSFDIGGAVVGDKSEQAWLLCKADGVLSGCQFFDAVFEHVGCTVEWHAVEGKHLKPSDTESGKMHIATVKGTARNLLLGERTALNILARASGIATRARRMADIREVEGWSGIVAGTRKITPGFRLVEKHAMLVGGCDSHRMDLSSMVMLKDNHIWSTGSITEAVAKARMMAGFSTKIEVECGSVDEAREAIKAGADVVMLDNFGPDRLRDAAALLKQESPHVCIEASGGITVDTIASFMSEAVDVISTSWIHQGAPHVDFSLKIAHD
eukprot:m.13382 g.13382  ORF g.13382 m.13382 type:complete len:295 (+) comp5937_c1_seq1:153-1037(+)